MTQILKVSGADAKRFINSQASLNLDKYPEGYSAFLSPKAELRGLCFLKLNLEDNSILLFCKDSDYANRLKVHLEKFIILEDVLIDLISDSADLTEYISLVESLNLSSDLILEDFSESDSLIKLGLIEKYFPAEKGCFPGQEVLSKFINIGLKKRKERAVKYVDEARDLFTRADSTVFPQVKELIEKAIKEDSRNEDAYELLGVVYARENKFDAAITAMKKLEELNPDSVMAKTNLSIFYMKIGDKETAEDYKAKATVAQFQEALKK